jgi:hypothetical protein
VHRITAMVKTTRSIKTIIYVNKGKLLPPSFRFSI